jgi:hypothetical protein
MELTLVIGIDGTMLSFSAWPAQEQRSAKCGSWCSF